MSAPLQCLENPVSSFLGINFLEKRRLIWDLKIMHSVGKFYFPHLVIYNILKLSKTVLRLLLVLLCRTFARCSAPSGLVASKTGSLRKHSVDFRSAAFRAVSEVLYLYFGEVILKELQCPSGRFQGTSELQNATIADCFPLSMS